MSEPEFLSVAGPVLLHQLAALSIVLGGLTLMLGLRRWATKLVVLGVFLAAMSGMV